MSDSWIGPWTYVGAITEVKNSLAWSDGLLNWRSGSFTEVPDSFLLGDVRPQSQFMRNSPWYGRLAALAALLLTAPLVGIGWIRNRGSNRSLFEHRKAVVPSAVTENSSRRQIDYLELNGFQGIPRRWPQLWQIVCGEFCWVGNRPLTEEQASALQTEFEQLWLTVPLGLFSLADSLGKVDTFDDETRAHASYQAVRGGISLDRTVLSHFLLRALFLKRLPPESGNTSRPVV